MCEKESEGEYQLLNSIIVFRLCVSWMHIKALFKLYV